MKKLKILVAITILSTVLVGCPTDDSILPSINITEDVTQDVPIAVTANANGDCIDYSQTATLDLRSNSQINENFSLIESVTVNSITWEVTDFVGDDGVLVTSALLKVGGSSFEIGNIDLKTADTSNEKFVLTDVAKLTAIGAEIISSGAVAVTFEVVGGGNCENDFSYTIEVTANVNVEVQPL